MTITTFLRSVADLNGIVSITKELRGVEATAKDASAGLAGLDKETTAANTSSTNWRSTLGAVSGALAALGVKDIVGDVLELTSKLSDLSAQTGISVEGLQRLDFIAQQNGRTLETLTSAIGMMGDRLVSGDKSAVAAVAQLGLTVEQLRALGPEQAFLAIATEIEKIPDPMVRSNIAMDLFGRTGQTLLPVLTSNVADLAKQAGVMEQDVVEAGDAIGDNWSTLVSNSRALVTNGFAPVIKIAASLVTGFVGVQRAAKDASEQDKANAKTLQDLVNPFGVVTKGVSNLITNWNTYKTDVTTAVSSTAANIQTWLVDKFSEVQTGVSTGLGIIKGYWTTSLTETTTTVTAIYNGAKQWLWDTFPTLSAGIKSGLDGIGTLWTNGKDAVVATAELLYDGVKTWLWDQFENIVGNIRQKLSDIQGYFGSLYQEVVGGSIVPDMVNQVGEWFRRMAELMDSGTQDGARRVTTALSGMNTTAQGKLGELAGFFGGVFGQGGEISGIMNAFDQIWGGARGIFGEGETPGGGWGAVGRFLSGIASMIQGVQNLVANIRTLIGIIRDIPSIPGGGNPPLTPPGGGGPPSPGPLEGSVFGLASGSRAGAGVSQTIVVELDGRQIARSTATHLPAVLKLQGIGRAGA